MSITKQQLHNDILCQKYNPVKWRKFFVQDLFPGSEEYLEADEIELGTKNQEDIAKSIRIWASANIGADRLVLVEVELKANINLHRKKVGLRNLVVNLANEITANALMVVFYHPDKPEWRLSYISRITDYSEGTAIRKETHPKRYTYVLGPQERQHLTARDRLFSLIEQTAASLKDVQEAFSVEKVSKEFFNEYKEHYQDFVQYLTGDRVVKKGTKWETVRLGAPLASLPTFFKTDEDAQIEKNARDFCKKLLGRIVFLYFVQKKRWLGASENSYQNGKEDFMQQLFDQLSVAGREGFYSNWLSTLFFDTLNNPSNDTFLMPNQEKVYVPFLNGGLFEKDRVDNKAERINFPPHFFSNINKKEEPKSATRNDVNARGFLDFLNAYNFTVYEDGPDDHTVAVDPEMLGHIFENLLEDNKDKGAFYTPKPIVHYMCQESLIEYLLTKLTNGQTETPEAEELSLRLEKFIKHHELANVVDYDKAIAQALRDVKVCDPAIGSGAFPMGLLQEIYLAVETLCNFSEGARTIWKQDADFDKWNGAKVKLDIIQNSIYGVDIEKGAVDIARLRFWLSLIVDEDSPKPLPNLDYKIMQGNSLLEEYEEIDLSQIMTDEDGEDENLFGMRGGQQLGLGGDFSGPQQTVLKLEKKERAQVQQLIQDYFNPFNGSDVEAYKAKQNIKKQIDSIVETQIHNAVLTYGKALQKSVKTQKQKWEMANIDIDKLPVSKNKAYNSSKAKLEKLELSEKQLLKIQKTDSRPYFLWHLFFKDVMDQGGFDIVIGNPPYLRVQGIRDVSPELADLLSIRYKSASGSFDLYAIFLEKALALAKNTGIVNFIMPVKWTNAAFGAGLREIVASRSAAFKIINFGAYQVFNASTYTGLQWFKKDSSYLRYYELNQNLTTPDQLNTYLQQLNGSVTLIPKDKLSKDTWTLTEKKATEILNKLNQNPLRLSDIFERIFTGLQTSKDDVYFLNECTTQGNIITGFSKELDERVQIEKVFTKPLLKGEDVHRYDILKTDRVVIFPYKLTSDTAVLYSESEIKSQFPLAYAYLKKCESVLRGREKGRFNIDGEWFQFGRKQGISSAEKEKLVAPEISLGGNFAYDEKGGFYSTTTVYGYIKKEGVEVSYKCLMAILNSQLFWWYLVNTGTVLANGYFRYKPNYIKPFPYPKSIPKEVVKSLEHLVDNLNTAKAQGDTPKVKTIDGMINSEVYKLYDLSSEDIAVINIK